MWNRLILISRQAISYVIQSTTVFSTLSNPSLIVLYSFVILINFKLTHIVSNLLSHTHIGVYSYFFCFSPKINIRHEEIPFSEIFLTKRRACYQYSFSPYLYSILATKINGSLDRRSESILRLLRNWRIWSKRDQHFFDSYRYEISFTWMETWIKINHSILWNLNERRSDYINNNKVKKKIDYIIYSIMCISLA